MQKERNKHDYLFWILLGLAGSLAIIAAFAMDVYAVEYPYDRSFITTSNVPLYQRTGGSFALVDEDQDGIVDGIYQKSGVNAIKIWGTNSFQNTITTTGGAIASIQAVKQDRILFTTATIAVSCSFSSEQKLLSTDAQVHYMTATAVDSGTDQAVQQVGLFFNNNKTVALYKCDQQTSDSWVVLNDHTAAWNATVGGTTANSLSSSRTHASIPTGAVTPQTFFGFEARYTNSTITVTNLPSLSATNIPTNTHTTTFPALPVSDQSIDIYVNGLEYPTGITSKSQIANTTDLQKKYRVLPSTTLNPNLLANLQLEYYNTNFAITNPRFLMENSTGTYLGTLSGSTLFFISTTDLQNQLDGDRVLATYVNDPSSQAFTQTIIQAPPTGLSNVQYFNPDFTVGTAIMNTPFATYPSGYGLKIQSDKLRFYHPEYDHTNFANSTYTPLQTNTVAHTSLTVEVKNAFPDTAIRLRDPAYWTNNAQYIWLIDTLQTDNTLTFSLVPNQCVYVDIKQVTDFDNEWVNIGFMCHNGLTYKILPNTSELAYTFWTFPHGVNHIYNNTNNELQTQVRHNTTPYQYNIRLYDSNNNLVFDQIYNSSSSVDLQTINATNFTEPIQLKVLDIDNANNTLYTATLGFPSYLSSIGVFLNTYLTHEGFALVAMMPLIFTAMFTRNTVGIGTVLTVVLIATMNWFGIITIPDYVLYAMFIVAAIGLIAYKTYN